MQFEVRTREPVDNKIMLNLFVAIPRYMDLCYTVRMNADQHIWQVWASYLQRWGVRDWAAHVLEAVGPLAILGAQVVYIGQPLLYQSVPEGHLDALARLLEDSNNTRAFVDFLREAPSQ